MPNMSLEISARNVGVAGLPDIGPANTEFAFSFTKFTFNIPADVMGLFETVKIEGIDKPTEVTLVSVN